jgi:hypothetical protein
MYSNNGNTPMTTTDENKPLKMQVCAKSGLIKDKKSTVFPLSTIKARLNCTMPAKNPAFIILKRVRTL